MVPLGPQAPILADNLRPPPPLWPVCPSGPVPLGPRGRGPWPLCHLQTYASIAHCPTGHMP